MDNSTLGRIVRNGKKYQQKNIPDFNNLIYTYNFLTLTLSEARNLTCVYVNLIQTRVRSTFDLRQQKAFQKGHTGHMTISMTFLA